MNRLQLGSAPCVRAREGISILHISAERLVECCDNAVWAAAYVAGLDAVKGAALGLFDSCAHLIEEAVADRSAGHSDGALDDLNIGLLGIEVDLFEVTRCVALMGRHKARTELNARGSQCDNLLDILLGVDAARSDHRDLDIVELFKGGDLSNNLRKCCLQRELGAVDLSVFVA